MFGGFDATKLKSQLKMAVSRLQIESNKKRALLQHQLRDVAKMLSEDPPKEELAKIRAEVLVRYDDTIEAYEILQLTCELLSERAPMIAAASDCPKDLHSTISTVIYASTILDIPELTTIRKLFKAKYGAKFIDAATKNDNGIINQRVVQKLSIMPPTAFIVQTYLEKIAEQFEIHWQPSVKLQPSDLCQPMAAPTGYSVMAAPATGFMSSSSFPPTNITTSTATPTTTAPTQPSIQHPIEPMAIAYPLVQPTAPSNGTQSEPDIVIARDEVAWNPSVDPVSDLERRLAQLKK